jgi:enoyl-CoA hydratase/carnithine racemase
MNLTAVTYDVDQHVALITLNRPEQMNAWNAAMATDLSEALTAANADDAVRAVVITGAGRAFCAGADLTRRGGAGAFAGREEGADPDQGRNKKNIHPYEINKPVIAAINGAAVGVGMTYPMLCDIRIVAEDAKMGFVFTRRGMIPELASHLLVQRVAGFSNAADVLMSGRIFLGKEAVELGIASVAVTKEAVLETAMEKAREYVNTAPVSVAITKKLIWQGLHTSMPEMLELESPFFTWVGNQADAAEGVMSFIEKRQPDWKLSAATDMPQDL